MSKVLIFGAGRSSLYLIQEIQHFFKGTKNTLEIIDINFDFLPENLQKNKTTTCYFESINNQSKIETLISNSNVVISLLPPILHIKIARLCLVYAKHFISASYISDEMQSLHQEAKQKDLLFLNEMGLDPGIDHMSALQLINKLRNKGAKIKEFYSHTGGLYYTQHPDDSWNYKFTWNPKNVVIAGAEGATYLEKHQIKTLTYNTVFENIKKRNINNVIYDSYPNRNSLHYIKKYQLENVGTLYRGTLRYSGFCEAWQVFIKLGITNLTTTLEFERETTRKEFLAYFLPPLAGKSIKVAFCETLKIAKTHPIIKKFEELHFFNDSVLLTKTKGSAANLLLSILESSWQLQDKEVDTIIMQHEVVYELEGVLQKKTLSLQVIGKNQQFTAMSKTVGLPIFEALKLLLNEQIEERGVITPTHESIYTPILKKLKSKGIRFVEKNECY